MTKHAQVRIRIGKRVCLIGVAIVALAGFCLSQSPSDWPQFHNTNMQRSNPYETVLNVNNVGNLRLNWSFDGFIPTLQSSPVVANGSVYVGASWRIYALNAGTGTELWWQGFTGDIVSAPSVADGLVTAGLQGYTLYWMYADTGALHCFLDTGDGYGVESSAAIANGILYDAQGSVVYSVAADCTGSLLFLDTLGGDVNYSSPAVVNGVVYVGSSDNNLYALNAGTGAVLWTYTTGAAVNSSPAVADGVVYVGSGDNNVYALNASTGALLWSYATGGAVNSSPALANGVVYVGSNDNNVYALDASTGSKLWTYKTGNVVYSSPAVANGVVYVGSEDNSIYALNASTGAKLWSYATGGAVDSSPTVVNGAVYVGSDDSQVYSFVLSAATLDLSSVPYPTPPVPGGALTYAFKVWNKTSEPADHEVLTTQVPAGTTFSSVELSGTAGLGSCTTPAVGASGAVVCKENSVMRPGSTWTIRMTVKVTASAGTVLTETATASADNTGSSGATVRNTVR
jgi:outer membrane protein assembly factor BamB